MAGANERRLYSQEFLEILEHFVQWSLFTQKLLNYTTSDASSAANYSFRKDQPAFVCKLKRGLLSPNKDFSSQIPQNTREALLSFLIVANFVIVSLARFPDHA